MKRSALYLHVDKRKFDRGFGIVLSIFSMLRIFVAAAFIAFVCSPSLARAEKSSLTFTEAIEKAVQHNPSILAHEHEWKASIKGYKAEKGRLYPQVNFHAQASRLSDPQFVVPIKKPGTFPALSRDIYQFSFEGTLPLYQGGRLKRRVKISELVIAMQKSLEKQTALDLIANVKNTFFLALYLKRLVSARERTLEALKREEREARLRLKVGRIPPLDLMRIETQVRAEEAALSAAKEALKRAKEALSVLMGEAPRSDFDLVGSLDAASFKFEEVDPEMALSCRPDIFAQKKAVEKTEEEVKLAFGEHLPSIDLFANYGRRAGSGFHHSEEVWEAGVRLKLNIFSGGTISAKVAQKRAELLAEREHLRALELSARKEIANAISLISQAKEEVAHLDAARKTAKEAFRVERLKYRTGAGTVTDMLLAQAAWAQAEADYLGALYRLASAFVEYQRATAQIVRGWIKLPCEDGND